MKKIKVIYTLTSPVSHIGETASTGSYFNTVLTDSGRLPVITGNSVRGIIRDILATHLLDTLSIQVDKEAFNVLYSGGNITGGVSNSVTRAKAIRERFPIISLLGAGVGDMIMQGKLTASFLYPLCKETCEITGIYSDISWHSLIDEMSFTRFDDTKKDNLIDKIENIEADNSAKASTQMRFEVQLMAIGTQFLQTLYLTNNCTDIEYGALLTGFAKWFEMPKIGGMSSKGFGFFDAELTDNEGNSMSVKDGEIAMCDTYKRLITDYSGYIADNCTAADMALLTAGGGKRGKG
ncbi:MAG: RAMP superfamily CRISPR-associated protein [Clostridiales bacterium]|nr:RAMP superfamily CRISPR-associated protein [Clostridiales bacterium]